MNEYNNFILFCMSIMLVTALNTAVNNADRTPILFLHTVIEKTTVFSEHLLVVHGNTHILVREVQV